MFRIAKGGEPGVGCDPMTESTSVSVDCQTTIRENRRNYLEQVSGVGNLPSTQESEAGLLEQAALVVSPSDSFGRRPLLGPDGREVGYAVWRRRSWWRGFTLAVHERRDSPLVFTVARRWLWPLRREVRDAEGELIGELAGGRVLDRWGDTVMRREREHVADMVGVVLATWSQSEAGLHLEFGSAIRSDPFACMLVLAGAIL